MRESINMTPDGVVHLSTKAEDIMVIVIGGKHRHFVFLPMWTGGILHASLRGSRKALGVRGKG